MTESVIQLTQNSDACPSSFFGFAVAAGLASVAAAAPGASGSIKSAESFAVRLTAVEIS